VKFGSSPIVWDEARDEAEDEEELPLVAMAPGVGAGLASPVREVTG
jgi:hypothetical protein